MSDWLGLCTLGADPIRRTQMADDRDRTEPEPLIDPEDVNSPPTSSADDVAEEVPVPVAMSPAEIDERAKVVEALKGKRTDERR
jgi:hypothetical protein